MSWKLCGIFFWAFFVSMARSEYWASQLSAGNVTVCAVLEDTTLKCWGSADYQKLPEQWGDESGEMGTNLPSIDLDVTVHDVAVSNHICALLSDGTLTCWGKNDGGQCGAGHSNVVQTSSAATVDLGTGRFATQVAMGLSHTCALLDDGTVKCWGSNGQAQLGTENTDDIGDFPGQMGDNLAPINLGSGRTAQQVVTGGKFTCALLDNGSVKCWGRNKNGQLGLGISANTWGGAVTDNQGDLLPAVSLGVGRTAKQISAGRYHACAILDDDSAKCWGDNKFGQLGQGHTNDIGDDPSEMGDLLSPINLGQAALQISAGETHTCAVLMDQSLKCWGGNSQGQLGLGDQTDRGGGSSAEMTNLPTVDVGTGLTVQSVSCSVADTTCVLLNEDHSIKCWGSNSFGQLGQGDINSRGSVAGEMGDDLPPVDLGMPTSTSTTATTTMTITTRSDTTSSSLSTTSTASDTSTLSTATQTTQPGESRARVVITEEEFEALEEERKAEATQAVQELDTAETAAVTQLLTEILLDEPSGAGVLGQGSKETGGGVMKMVAVSPEAVVESGENVTVVGDQGAVRAEVPAEVVQLASQLAGATNATNGSETMILITITELSNDVADKLRSDNARITAQGRRLASSLKTLPINMKLRTAEGEELRISGLNQPIVFMLPIDNDTSDVPYCAFWDEERAIWSTEGVSTLPSTTPGKVLCSTTHLSIFGGVFEVLVGDMAQVLRCSTAFVVFSAEGLLNLFKTQWLWQGPSLVTFSLLLLFTLFFLISLHLDRKASRYFPDKDKEAAFWPLKEPDKEEGVEGDLESAQPDEEKRKTCCSGGCKGSIQYACEWLLWCVGLLFGFENLAEVVKELLPNAAVGVVDRCIEQIHAHKTGTSRDSLHAVGDITKVLAGEDRTIQTCSAAERPQLVGKGLTVVCTPVANLAQDLHSPQSTCFLHAAPLAYASGSLESAGEALAEAEWGGRNPESLTQRRGMSPSEPKRLTGWPRRRRPHPQPEGCRSCGVPTHGWCEGCYSRVGSREPSSAFAGGVTGCTWLVQTVWPRASHGSRAAAVMKQPGANYAFHALVDYTLAASQANVLARSVIHTAHGAGAALADPHAADQAKREIKLHALFQFAVEHLVNLEELVPFNDPARMQALRQNLMACASLSLERIRALLSSVKRWVKFARKKEYPARAPMLLQVAEFLRQVGSGGPSAAASMYHATRWFEQNMGVSLQTEDLLVKPRRLHHPTHCAASKRLNLSPGSL
eukprot:s1868_g4.t2